MLKGVINYILSNRPVDADGKLKPKEVNPEPSGKHYFGKYEFPEKRNHTKHATVEVEELDNAGQQAFIDMVVDAVRQSPVGKRDVLFYVHGFYLEDKKSLRLHLLYDVYRNYVDKHVDPKIAKIIYFTWPATGKRHELDDRAYKMGQNLFDYYDFLLTLSKKMKKEGSNLHLLSHSFAHHLLNGFLDKQKHQQWQQSNDKIFDQAFLMGGDISHKSIAINPNNPDENGITLPNIGQTADVHYDLTKLKYIANEVHIFHDYWDYLLYMSVKRQFKAFDRRNINIPNTLDFMCLGNFGPEKKSQYETDFHYYNIINPYDPDKFKQDDLPKVTPLTHDTIVQQVIRSDFSFNTIKNLQGLHKINRTVPRHRAFYCGKAIIEKVSQIINNGHPLGGTLASPV